MRNKSDMTETRILSAMHAIVPLLDGLSHEGRTTLLCAMLAQQVCSLPHSERSGELAGILDDLPGIVRSTEEGMQMALVENARRGL